MSHAVKIPQGSPTTIAYVNKVLINEFQQLTSKDKYMNEMIEIKPKPGDSVWEIDRKVKQLKGKLKYPITKMKHRKLFIKSLFPHFKYS